MVNKKVIDYNKFMISKVGSGKFNRYNTKAQYINPTIIEEREMNIAVMDVFSRLMMDRILFIGSEIDSDTANIVQSQLLYLNSVSDEDINIYINTPGGSVYDGLAIYDTIRMIKPITNTRVVGLAASMGAILLLAGENRSSLKNSKIMLHQPLGGAEGQASDIEITAREIISLKEDLYMIVAERTNLSYDDCVKLFDRDRWMKPAEAMQYGIIHEIK